LEESSDKVVGLKLRAELAVVLVRAPENAISGGVVMLKEPRECYGSCVVVRIHPLPLVEHETALGKIVQGVLLLFLFFVIFLLIIICLGLLRLGLLLFFGLLLSLGLLGLLFLGSLLFLGGSGGYLRSFSEFDLTKDGLDLGLVDEKW